MLNEKPTPAVMRRSPNTDQQQIALDAGLSPVLARVIASRNVPHEDPTVIIRPAAKLLDDPKDLPDIDVAADRIVKAILDGEVIGGCLDFDCDGTGAGFVFHTAITEYFGHPADKFVYFVGHRINDGYGLSDNVAKRILENDPGVNLVITADNGSSDEPRIALLKENGIDTIVSDHHGLPEEGPPKSAVAVVSPAREDSVYPDPYISGCMVAWLLMCQVRRKLIAAGWLPEDAPKLTGLLGAVAMSTVADCVDLRSINSRIVILAGLQQIEAGTQPCWRAARPAMGGFEKPVTAESLAFSLGPHINSRSRVSDPMASAQFLMSKTDDEARHWWGLLEEANTERKAVERKMTEDAVNHVLNTLNDDDFSIAHFDESFSIGVNGIVASRLVEAFGRVTAVFAPDRDHPTRITGSCRTVGNCHILNALKQVDEEHPELFYKYGGHSGAGGLSLNDKKDLPVFQAALEKAVKAQMKPEDIGPRVFSDGELESHEINLTLVDELGKLEPYGKEFDMPRFDNEMLVIESRPIGDGTHLKLVLEMNGEQFAAVWFRAQKEGEAPAVQPGESARFVYAVKDNIWRGNRSLQLMVETAVDIQSAAGMSQTGS